jgi:hypothetical protein
MQHYNSLPFSQQPANDPYPEPHPLHTLSAYFFKLHFNNILQSTPSHSKRGRPSWLFDQYFICSSYLDHACYMPRLRKFYQNNVQ